MLSWRRPPLATVPQGADAMGETFNRGAKPSSSPFRRKLGSVRGGACHHVNGEFVSFVPARGNESLLRFAHNGIHGAECRTIVQGKAIAPTSCTPRIVVARCGKDEKELRLRDGLGKLRPQVSPLIGTG